MSVENVIPHAPPLRGVLPGLALSVAVTAAAVGCEALEQRLFGYAYIDGLVVAILLGTLLHTVIGLAPAYVGGVKFASKTVLEVAIVLLGGTISAAAIASSGAWLIVSVV